MKQETTFSLFRRLTINQPAALVTLADVYRFITTDPSLKENTEKYRYFQAQGFDDDAGKIKRSRCPAFTPAAVFNGSRSYKNVAQFTGYSLVDIATHVSRFEAPSLEMEQILKHFRKPNPGEAYEIYSVADVLGVINLELKTTLSHTKVGMLMNQLGFRKIRKDNRRGYMVHRYCLDEISRNRKGVREEEKDQELPF